jgi:hypothetical protein
MAITTFARPTAHLRCSSIFRAMVAVTLAGAAAACGAPPKNLDLSLNRTTDQNLFRVKLASGTTPIPRSKVHEWSVQIVGSDGTPVTGAILAIDGGMPEHGHGLPTRPRAQSSGPPGDYVIKGMKFSMRGWWVLKLDVRAPDGRTDKITFNLVL